MNIYVFTPLQYNKCSGVFLVMKKIIAIVMVIVIISQVPAFRRRKSMNLILIQNHAY